MPRAKKAVVVTAPAMAEEELAPEKFVIEEEAAAAEAAVVEPIVPDEKLGDKAKRTRKPSAYNMLLGEFMKKISLEEAEKPEDERIPRKERMSKAQEMYREWKKLKNDMLIVESADEDLNKEVIAAVDEPVKKGKGGKGGKGKKAAV